MGLEYIVHPEIDYDSAPYWQSLKAHQVKLQKCTNCGGFRFPPSPSCYNCGTLGGDWTPISGKGTVYSWTVIHHPIDKRLKNEVPFIIVLIELEEGPRVAGRLIDCDKNKIKAGMKVISQFDDIDSELTLLNFTPADKADKSG